MQVSSGALREGLLHDLIGRTHHEDLRPRTVAAMARLYGVDEQQSTRVADTAEALLRQSSGAWGLSAVDDGDLLSWAAQLHEIGLSVAHTHYHKHAEYLTSNADMPGFSQQEQAIVAFLTRAHRRKFPMKALATLPEYLIERVMRLALLLRLSVLLHRAREDRELPALSLVVNGGRLQLRFPDRWLDMHPLTLALLEEERLYIEKTGYALCFT
jgi:exopolyphosphatase/guanosine-5'-triphosphate,3'-diphosphate pyrophosphatase